MNSGKSSSVTFPSALSDEQLRDARVLPRRNYPTWIAAIVVLAFAGALIQSFAVNPAFGWDVVAEYFFAVEVMAGLKNTLMITVISMCFATTVGLIVALFYNSGNIVLVTCAKFYIWIFRSVPLLVQIIFWYNLAALYPTIHFGLPFLPPFFSADTNMLISALSAAVIAITLNEGAYMAEIIRSGLNSVDGGQREAARALGLSSWSAFTRIILPQAMRVIIPPTGNQTISMLKYTSLVSVIALPDILYSTQLISSRTFEVIPMLLVASLWYLLLTTILMGVQGKIERYFGKSVK